MKANEDDDFFIPAFDTALLTDAQWRIYMEKRMDRQDRVLRRIFLLLLVGKSGWLVIRWVAVTALAMVPAYLAWRSK